VKQRSVSRLVHDHWCRYGRDYYRRCDYEAIDSDQANLCIEALRASLNTLPGMTIEGYRVKSCDDFSYLDPIDGTRSERQGIRIQFANDSRLVFRLSGTGTEGATLRVYMERHVDDWCQQHRGVGTMMRELSRIAQQLGRIVEFTGRTHPDVII